MKIVTVVLLALRDHPLVQEEAASLPNGHGIRFPDSAGVLKRCGVSPNDLTSVEGRDPIAGTPWHKHVRARIEAVE